MVESVPFWFAALLLISALFLAEFLHRKLFLARKRMESLKKDLEGALAELESAAGLRSELLSRIGQSLRKPLESIRNATDEISRPLECPDWMKSQLELLTREIDTISKFIDLISEIVTLDKMTGSFDTLPLHREPLTDLEAILIDVVQASSGRLAERGISMTVALDPGIMVRGDEGYLKQAFDALVSETERFAGKGSIVHVDLAAGEGTARLTLDYRGAGDPEASSSSLSLELARHIITGHGGWIQEASKKGQLVVELPTAVSAGGSQDDEQRDIPEV